MSSNTIKQPKKDGVAKVPVVIQLETVECGAACLTMVLGYYNKWIPLEKVRLDCGVSRDGSKAGNMLKAARNYGLIAKGYKCEPEDLKDGASFPCIIHWNFNHFVVLCGFKGGKAIINDPANGVCSVSMEEFDESFTGVCLMFEPGESFSPSGKPKSVLAFAKKRLANLKAPIIITILSSVIVTIFGIIDPVFERILYDRLLSGQNPQWFRPFIIALAILYLLKTFVNFILKYTTDRIDGKINTVGNLSYMWKILHLPMHFFSQRNAGDIAGRQDGNAVIADSLINVFAPLVINGVMMLFYLFVMIKYSWILTVVGVVTALLNIAVTQLVAKRRVNLSRVLLRDSSKLASVTVSGIQMIETIKASGAEDGFFEKWAGSFAAVNKNAVKLDKDYLFISMVPSILSEIADALILGLGIYLTMNGEFTLGSIAAFQGFFGYFMAPVDSFITAGETIQEMKASMERIDDVMEYPVDSNIAYTELEDSVTKLSGSIEIKNISFGYSPLDAPLIKDFSMSIKKGSSVAFVGSSGCGKSTLSKLISGMYSPWEGEILFDGKRVDQIDHNLFTASLAVVDQDITLFEDTISANIKMWDESIEDFEMILAAKDAQMHYDIIAKDGGYQHHLSEGGKDISGGQRQRLEIARVLAQEPNIVILDEATSALDTKTENDVVNAIKARGITTIVIAHRLSTIRDCDEIVVLDKGNVVERGTHEELMARGGLYSELVTSD